MLRNTPFPCERVHVSIFAPSPIIQYLEKDNDDNEVIKEFNTEEYYKKYPLCRKQFSLQELLDAGIPLNRVDTHLYESNDSTDRPWNTDDLIDAAREIREQMDVEDVEQNS